MLEYIGSARRGRGEKIEAGSDGGWRMEVGYEEIPQTGVCSSKMGSVKVLVLVRYSTIE